MSAGRHGTIAMWNDGKVRITIRPKSATLVVEDLAMIVGHALDITHTHSRSQAIQRIQDWQDNRFYPSKITAKVIKQMRINYLHRWQTHITETFDGDVESHRVLLELVHDRMPRFRKVEAEWDEE